MAAVRADEPVPLAPPDRQTPDLEMPDPPGKKLGSAVVGLGKLALVVVLPAFRLCRRSRPSALVSGQPLAPQARRTPRRG